MTTVIGLTGGIGSGKSTISGYLKEFGANVIDADKVGHEAFQPGTPAWNDVVNAFGREIISTSGEIDRKKLAEVVFKQPEARQELNRIMWSRIWEMIEERIKNYGRQGGGVVVIEAFGLIEAGWDKLVDRVWVTEASERTVIERLKKQRKMTEEEIKSRIHSQLSTEERARHADAVIENEGDPQEVKAKVKALWDRLKSDSL